MKEKVQFINRKENEDLTNFVCRVWKTINPDSTMDGRRDQKTIVKDGYSSPYPTGNKIRRALKNENVAIFASEAYDEKHLRTRLVWYAFDNSEIDNRQPTRVAYAVKQ